MDLLVACAHIHSLFLILAASKTIPCGETSQGMGAPRLNWAVETLKCAVFTAGYVKGQASRGR